MTSKEDLLIKHIDEKFMSVNDRLDKIELKVDILNSFRIKIIGIIIGLVGLAETVRFLMGE